jgi:type IV secretory pathway VirJ component
LTALAAVLVSLSLTGCSHGSGASPREQRAAISDTLRFGRFGPVVLYRQRVHPSRVVLLVSGDGGWNLGVVGMAREIAGMDALVVGIDIRRYLTGLARSPERCSYPAADFEALSQWLQRRLNFPRYIPPILMGYSSGATLVYATLVQAPPGTFAGGISLGFCSDLAVKRTFCSGSGLESSPGLRGRGIRFAPAGHLAVPWIVLQGAADSACGLAQAAAFVRRTPGASLVALPSVGHGFGVPGRWLPQLRDAFTRLDRASLSAASTPAPEVRDLPLVELPAAGGSRTLAVVVSGDGGWASLDRQIGESLSQEGISVVGINSLKYFWRARTPDGTAADLTRVLRHYLPAWSASRILLVGYSRGADVLPFMASRLPADLRQKIRLVALLGFSHRAGFELHLTDFLGGSGRGVPTVPEVRKLRGMRVLCVYGSEETDSACRDLSPDLASGLSLSGGHHFGGAYREIARSILREAGDS